MVSLMRSVRSKHATCSRSMIVSEGLERTTRRGSSQDTVHCHAQRPHSFVFPFCQMFHIASGSSSSLAVAQ